MKPVQSFAQIHGELISLYKKDNEGFRFKEFEVFNCTLFFLGGALCRRDFSYVTHFQAYFCAALYI